MSLTTSTIPTALVISAGGSPGAYDIIRSLAMAGIRTHVASSQSDDIAFYSRYCGEKIVLPPFDAEHFEDIVHLLLRFAARNPERLVLYYASDAELTFVQRFRNELGRAFRFLLPNDELLEQLFNKVLFSELAERYQLPVPPARRVFTVEELQSIIPTISFPCIVKPAFSQDWVWDTIEQQEHFGPYKKALRRFDSQKQLSEFCSMLPQRASGFLVQSYVEGRDEEIPSFHGYFDEQSRCLGYFLGCKIRTYPPHTGGSAYVHTFYNPELAQLSIEYLQRIKFKGIVKIDYKWDRQERQFMILEINPRYNLWELLGAYAGMNLAEIAYRHQREEHPEAHHYYIPDARLLYFKQDLRAFLSGYKGMGEWSIGSYIQSLRVRKYYRVYDPNDVRPFLKSSLSFFMRLAARRVVNIFYRSKRITDSLPAAERFHPVTVKEH